MAVSGASMPFIKNLASSDRKIRTQALDNLKAFLAIKYAPAAAPLTFREARKLWAGLFYALWMADRARAQQRLCAELAGLPRAAGLPDAAVAMWLRGFWATMAQQWTTGIDVLRMDKFMLLVRRVLGAQLEWMAGVEGEDGENKKRKRSSDETEATTEMGLAILSDWPWNPEAEAPLEDALDDEEDEEANENDDDADEDEDEDEFGRPKTKTTTMRVPVGLAIHVLDIWVDELERLHLLGAGDEDHQDLVSAGIAFARRLNALVETLAARIAAPAVRVRARQALADERLPWNARPGQSGGGLEAEADDDDDDTAMDDDDASWDGFNN